MTAYEWMKPNQNRTANHEIPIEIQALVFEITKRRSIAIAQEA